MRARGRMATVARQAARRFRTVLDFAAAARAKPDDDFHRKMTFFLVIVIAALAMVVVRKLMGCYP